MKVQKFTYHSLALALGLIGTCALTSQPGFALGVGAGGGGSASEMTVDEIRADILNWIGDGGALGLTLPSRITYDDYKTEMTEILQPHVVVIGFVTTEQENETQDPEMKVIVNGGPKDCRGFISTKDHLPHILCNTDRFPTSGGDQYRLIHHEYAGLAGVPGNTIELNVGASSDYEISNQITDYLVPETVLRLAVKTPASTIGLEYIKDGSSGQSPYQKIDALFKQASPMQLSQFPTPTDSNFKSWRCVYISQKTKVSELEPITSAPAHLQGEIVLSPAQPPTGPAFPGSPEQDQWVDYVAVTDENFAYSPTALGNSYVQYHIQMSTSPGVMTWSRLNPDDGSYGNQVDLGTVTSVYRTIDGTIIVAQTSNNQDRPVSPYTYCYQLQ